jgi:hypothetical protein
MYQDKWRNLFDQFDPEGFGEIPWTDFFCVLARPEFKAQGKRGRHLNTAFLLAAIFEVNLSANVDKEWQNYTPTLVVFGSQT